MAPGAYPGGLGGVEHRVGQVAVVAVERHAQDRHVGGQRELGRVHHVGTVGQEADGYRGPCGARLGGEAAGELDHFKVRVVELRGEDGQRDVELVGEDDALHHGLKRGRAHRERGVERQVAE